MDHWSKFESEALYGIREEMQTLRRLQAESLRLQVIQARNAGVTGTALDESEALAEEQRE